MVKNAYIHIPFCKSKCNYCTFTSFASTKNKKKYIKALISEIKSEYKGENLSTVYFGGGTPSLLLPEEISSILELLKVEKNAQITLEANPEGICSDYLNEIYQNGINRISFGVQSFDDKKLEEIGRLHTSKTAIDAVKSARSVGFKNISIDLIYGLPSQTREDFLSDLKMAVSLNVEHISLYGLQIEKGCVFYLKPPLNLPSNDVQAEMITLADETLCQYGFEHYEISNFCKKGFQSNHNLNYWNNCSYYGFGLGASGYSKDFVRYKNTISMNKYLENPVLKDEKIFLSPSERLEEEIFLGLRKREGINFRKINEKFNIDFEKKYDSILKRFEKYLIKDDFSYKLTEEGFLISNEIMSEFVEI